MLNEKMRILEIGPSPYRSKGGMTTVIKDIVEDEKNFSDYYIDYHESYIDGNKAKILIYSLFSLLRFFLGGRSYDIYHLHVASNGSTYRKILYSKLIKKWKKKLILQIHGGGFIKFYLSVNESRKRMIRKFLYSADCIIALSDEWKNIYEEYFKNINIVVLENGVNLGLLSEAISEASSNEFLVLSRMNSGKGTYDLIEAIDSAKDKVDIHFYFAGDGEIEKVADIIKERKLEDIISIAGWVDEQSKLELLKKVRTVVLPSYHEGLPMCILEGMASEKAIISTTVGAIPGIITSENGILINAGDIKSLTDAIIMIAQNTELARRMGEKNRILVSDRYSMDTIHKRLSDIYCKTISIQ